MTLLPNLVKDQLTVRYSLDEIADAQLHIVDINGQILRQYSCGMSNEMQLNVSDLAAGFYFIQILSQEKMMVRKFVKQ